MPLPDPVFDPRKYRDILAEAVRRIPVHNPEWTNHSDSDPGITLLQLFAFMTESVIYRANRIPERNRQRFLRLLGIGIRPATAARGLVAFSRRAGPLETVTLGPGQQLLAGKIPFRTARGLDVLPVEATVYYKHMLTGDERTAAEEIWRDLYASFEEPPGDPASLAFYATRTLETPKAGMIVGGLDVGAETVDGLWLALFARRGDDPEAARQAIAGKTLSLAIMPALDVAEIAIEPERALHRTGRLPLVFETPNTAAPEGTGAAYNRLPSSAEHDPLSYPTVVELTLGDADSLRSWTGLEPLEAGTGDYPPAIEDEQRAARLITWIRVRLPKDAGSAGGQPAFRVSWVGINAAETVQRAQVAAELLPTGTGEPDQTATLANTPVLPDSLRVLINGEKWTQIDDITAARPETVAPLPRLVEGPEHEGASGVTPPGAPARVYSLDPESGVIRFGTGLVGARPPRGAVILASYDYGGGSAGMVGIGAIKKGTLPSGLEVTNPVPTWGGAAAESVAEAERRVPRFIANRDRLVTAKDIHEITAATPGVDIGRHDVMPLLHPEHPGDVAPGVITVMVIPATDPRNPRAPVPDRLFLDAVCKHLSPRRLITTELHVRGPTYVDIWVSVAIDVVTGRAQAPVREAVRAAIVDFLSPLTGGFAGTGWPLGRPVDPAELLVQAARVHGVQRITRLILGDSDGERTDPRALGALELPRLAGIEAVTEGDPVPLADLAGTAPADIAGPSATPVPIVPQRC